MDDEKNSVISYDTTDYNLGDKISDYLRSISVLGNTVSFVPHPAARIGGAAVAGLTDTGANITDMINGRVGIMGGLGRTIGDLGIDALSILYPGAKTLKVMKSTPKLGTVYKAASKTTKAIDSASKTKKLGLVAGLTGAGVGLEYGFPGTWPSNQSNEFRDPFTGTYNEVKSDILNFDDPEAWGRAMKVAQIPAILLTRGTSSKVAKASSKAKKTPKASTKGTKKPSTVKAAATSGAAASSGAAAAVGGAATGAATGATAGGAAAVLLGANKPKTVSATPTTTQSFRYTGQPEPEKYQILYTTPSGPKMQGYMFRRKGGKLNLLRELRQV